MKYSLEKNLSWISIRNLGHTGKLFLAVQCFNIQNDFFMGIVVTIKCHFVKDYFKNYEVTQSTVTTVIALVAN